MTHATANGGEPPRKLRKTTAEREDKHHQPLLPGLPDHVAQLSLSLLHPSILFSVSRPWRRLLYSTSFPPFLSLYAVFLSTQTNNRDQSQTHLCNSIELFSFDPISSTWHNLPPPPPDTPLRPIVRHPSFLSRILPIQSVSVSGKLVLFAATAEQLVPAFPRPLVFNPLSQNWAFGPPLTTPRRWCAGGACRGALYIASGIGSHYRTDVARSVEKWELKTEENDWGEKKWDLGKLKWNWEKLGRLDNEKLSREAIAAVGWREKLCMVDVKGDSAKNGFVYDIKRDVWEEMPEGMIGGWRGPAAAMDEETLFVVDESKGVLRKYDAENDRWEEVVEAESLRGAEQIAAAGGRVCVVRGGGGGGIVVVDVVASPARYWMVDTPAGFQAVAVHILPRTSKPDFEEDSATVNLV